MKAVTKITLQADASFGMTLSHSNITLYFGLCQGFNGGLRIEKFLTTEIHNSVNETANDSAVGVLRRETGTKVL